MFSKRSQLSIAVNQNSLSFPVFWPGGGENLIFILFFFEKKKKKLPPFLPNNVKTADPKETKKTQSYSFMDF